MYDMKALYEAYSVEEAVKLRLEHPEAFAVLVDTAKKAL